MTHTTSSTQIRERLRQLETDAAQATAAVLAASVTHDNAKRRAVITADAKPLTQTEAALAVALRTRDRAADACETARRLLDDATQRERDEFEAATRADLDKRLADLTRLAQQADTAFGVGVALLVQLRQLETGIVRDAQGTLGARPASSPLIAREAAARFGAYLRGIGGNLEGLTPEPWTEAAAEAAARNVRRALEMIL